MGRTATALDVAAALARITPEQRAVVVLHDVMELPVEQIAEDLQLATGAVKSRLARARRALVPAGGDRECVTSGRVRRGADAGGGAAVRGASNGLSGSGGDGDTSCPPRLRRS